MLQRLEELSKQLKHTRQQLCTLRPAQAGPDTIRVCQTIAVLRIQPLEKIVEGILKDYKAAIAAAEEAQRVAAERTQRAAERKASRNGKAKKAKKKSRRKQAVSSGAGR